MVTALAALFFAALASLGVWHFRAKIERIGKKPQATTPNVVEIDFPRRDVG